MRVPVLSILASLLALAFATGCATSRPQSSDLQAARKTLDDARAKGAYHAASAESRRAKLALVRAERCEHERGEISCRDLSYVALRRAQLALIAQRIVRAKDNERAAKLTLQQQDGR